jgi:hypothetical protein
MVTKKDLIIAVLCTFCLASTLFMMAKTTSSPDIGTYDPWVDLNDDGYIDVFDAVTLAGVAGTSGDPTKNVNVTNWPTSHDVLVWWGENLVGLTGIASHEFYNANGFGQLHVLVNEQGLTGAQQVTVNFRVKLLNGTKMAFYPIIFYTFVLTVSKSDAAVTVSVPSEIFYFQAVSNDASINCHMYMSFYLTWS